MGHPLWPLFDLRIRTGPLVLRLPTDDDLVALAALARAGIHGPDEMPFGKPWSTRPSPDFERGFFQHHLGLRANWRPDDWGLDLLTEHEGAPIGMQGLFARRFAILRTVDTGSWLGRDWQGRGHGKTMRQAVLTLAFDHLGAEVARSKAFADNVRSAGVSRSIGYRENGIGRLAPEGIAREAVQFRLTREDWLARPRPAVEVAGLDACLELFGVPATS